MRKQTGVEVCAAKLLVSLAATFLITIQGGVVRAQTAEPATQAQAVKSQQNSANEVTALSLQEAIQFAIANNLNTKLAGERRNESLGVRLQALAALLPNVSAWVSQANNTRNLAAER